VAVICWAECLGGCSQKQSREHYISESLFPNQQVSVRGFPWCKNTTTQLPMRKLASNILCTRHNNRLSPVDDAAREAFQTLRRAWELHKERSKLKSDYRRVRRHEINGAKLERWLLKTAINIWFPFRGETGFGNICSAVDPLPPALVEAAFGAKPLTAPLGLYWVGYPGQSPRVVGKTLNHVSVAGSLGKKRGAQGCTEQFVAAVAFSFQGCRFLLWADDRKPPATLSGIRLPDEDWEYCVPIYHVKQIQLREDKYLSQRIIFKW